jgi:S1-C subfamily serine protease
MKDRREQRWPAVVAWVLAGALPVVALAAFRSGRVEAEDVKAPPAKKKVARVAAVDPKVLEAEKKRVAVIEKVKPAVVAVMAQRPGAGITGNGSGVLIDEDGYALTNFHVTAAAGGPTMKCGLPDGVIYDAVLVGLDKVGDVALIKLLPKKPGDKFPFAPLGDSDKVKAGDWSLAMGNPFALATDFTPTVTFGLVSGVHRYQYPSGTLLEYTDCIQIDTSINPGNSGGPLFNMDGELIGINGRGSFEKRGRVNSGVGYAISINQIKNFMGQLRAGMDTDHASLGASMTSEEEEGALSRILVQSIIDSDARRRGLDVGDQLVSFGGRPMTTVNQFKNVLGLFPKGWRVPLVFRHDNRKKEVLVRLMGVQRLELDGGPMPKIMPKMGPMMPAGPAAALYKAKAGFANYYFNEQAQKALWTAFRSHGDFRKQRGDWSLKGSLTLYLGADRGRESPASFAVKEGGAADGKSVKVLGDINDVPFGLEPLNPNERSENFKLPTDSGGFLLALYQYRQLLAFGEDKGFVGEFTHGGVEPFYPPPGGKEKVDYAKARVLAEVFRTKHAGVAAKWFFATANDPGKRWLKGQLIGFEVHAEREDPCEVFLSDYRPARAGEAGKLLPHRLEIWRGDKRYGVLKVSAYDVR